MPADAASRPVGSPSWRVCVAPMMDWTDRHCRYFHRLLAPSARLYTEMLTTGAVIHGDREHLLGFDPAEHPVALQLGGSEPGMLARAAEIGAGFGYDEINLNCGCPSDRVQQGRFGACLMNEPERVRDCLAAMREAVSVPVTVKTRIGVDDNDSERFLQRFVATVAESGVDTFIIHARKAWLSGLSPKQNREVPPLDHARVRRLAESFPGLRIVLNGGIQRVDQAVAGLGRLTGVMLGRTAYRTPWVLAELADALGVPGVATREAAVLAMADYAEAQCERGVRPAAIVRHVLGLYHGQPGARAWRRHLSQHMHLEGAGPGVLRAALQRLPASAGAAAPAGSPSVAQNRDTLLT
ncbi:MAG: tRNA dihydrouridine(20/20a) synthase DusA [Wenzhouxiangellaceae bacterium]|nr:tRNA dihydrouridine(20/20a) synthase DusA [Wenzhouxiangellaceae bacterium]MBS3746836.1 tRNA dihydrouridine(20/20a) synthase DusA [Wenzhouxiangellaceae bacterium]MBS3823355.1 tRNA dihydrouridine(20/20a) synthase DusA [Wenzhouxiangellaceae bacterium]